MFTKSTAYNWQMFARWLSGFSQVIQAIFLPVWVDFFAPHDRKTKWMTWIIGAAPLGMLSGYSMSALIVSFGLHWCWAFYIHVVLLLPFILGILIVDPKLLQIDKKQHTQEEYDIANIEGGIEDVQNNPVVNQALDPYERFNYEKILAEEHKTKNFTFWQKVGYVLKKANYVTLMLSITSLFIVSTGIQFWCTDFFINVLQLPQREAFQNYAICGAVSPICGVLLSGVIFDRIGGYNSQNALPTINIFGFIALMAALLTTILTDTNSVTIFLAIEGMCGGILMPAATGIMLNQVPASMRTASNSIANLSYNLFGYVPAPYLYGHF
jgi:MFS family permease